MISLKQFIANTKGKKIDVPWGNGKLKGQCVSLIQQYILQCLGQPAKARGNAKDWDETYVKQGLGKIVKSPRYGDLIVFNTGSYGHIAIYINSTTMYDQNNGSHDNRCAGYANLMKGGVYIRPNATLIPDKTAPTTYTKGVYKVNYNLNIRNKANGTIVKVKNCTQAMRSALTSKVNNANAVIKKGTNITILEVVKLGSSYWGRNYSGWICIKGTKEYCSKIG